MDLHEMLLEDEIRALLQARTWRLIQLVGPAGSGKTTALQHLAAVLRPGGRFTSVTDVSTSATRGAGYVPTVVAPNGHKLADLLFKVASHRLHSHAHRTLSFDQVADAVNPRGNDTDGRIVLAR